MDNQDLQRRVELLEKQVGLNNFSARQDFVKFSNFTTRLKVPHYASLPATCEQGEIAETSGKLYVCSAANTWTVAGTQS